MLFPALTEVLDPEPHSAALNMAIDEILLRTASEPLLRVYRWERPAVSFGYFGKWAEIAPAWPGRDLVRRWTGGGVVEHGEDLTYTLIVPRGHPFFAYPAAESYRMIHEAIAKLFADLKHHIHLADASDSRMSVGCFEGASQHDLLADDRKIAGAAQRRTREGLLHQGSMRSPFQKSELNGSQCAAFLSACVRQRELTQSELLGAHHLTPSKYASVEWLRRF